MEQGAEAIIREEDGTIIKDRIEKSYRHPELDRSLRKSRTKREAKVLTKLEAINFPSPRLLRQEDFALIMEKIDGPQVKEVFALKHAEQIGKLVGELHKNKIIHGDLTTSNMIERDNQIILIDFGLSQFSDRVEDQAVDLHLLKHALESKHWKEAEEAFKIVLESYQEVNPHPEVLKRLKVVEQRGRNKGKGD